MAGETVGMGNANYNPYLMQQYAAANDDVMANLHFKEIEQSGKIPGLTETAGSPAFRGAPETDTFEKQDGGPGLGTMAVTAATGAGIGGLGGYFLMNNPIKKDGDSFTLKNGFYKTIDKADLAEKIKQEITTMKNTQGYNLAQLAKVDKFEDLPQEVQTYLKNNNLDKLTPAEAKEAIERAGKKVEYFDLDNIAKRVTEKFKGTEYYNNIIKTSTDNNILNKINEAKDLDELKALIAKHKDFFGISGTEEDIALKIESLARNGKDTVADKAGQIIADAENKVLARKSAILNNLDESGKLLENADDVTKNLFKDFKLQQAKKFGIWGAIIGAGLVTLYGLFGGSTKAKA